MIQHELLYLIQMISWVSYYPRFTEGDSGFQMVADLLKNAQRLGSNLGVLTSGPVLLLYVNTIFLKVQSSWDSATHVKILWRISQYLE